MKSKILILGANGLLGNTLLKYFISKKIVVRGVIRKPKKKCLISKYYILSESLVKNNNLDLSNLKKIIKSFKPKYIINCIGITKARRENKKILNVINGTFPRKLGNYLATKNIKLIHFSTDCVFNGKKGFYTENDTPNAIDSYGKSKLHGEFMSKNSIVFRTSMIGHSMTKNNGLLEWFLNKKKVKGYSCMYFSGPTALEIGKIIYKYILKKNCIKSGLYNLGIERISKYKLLLLLKKIYGKKIKIVEDFDLSLDRSLIIKKFVEQTKYQVPTWEKLITEQKIFWEKNKINYA